MLDSVFIDNMNTLLKVTKKNDEPFGGSRYGFRRRFYAIAPCEQE